MTYIFIHIPKCAGNGIAHIYKRNGWNTSVFCNWLCTGSGHFKPMTTGTVGLCKKNVSILKSKPNTIWFLTHHKLPRNKLQDDFIISSIRDPYEWYVSRWSYHISCKIYDWGRNPNNINDFQKWLKVHAGLYSQRVKECCFINDNCIVDFFIDLRKPMSDSFEKLNTLTDLTIKKFDFEKVNSSKHLDVDKYYTDEFRKLIQYKDKFVFDLLSKI